jgi:hypothetical protein
MYIGKRVRLKSVDNKQSKPTTIKDSENYWRLIGCEGEIISDAATPWSKSKYRRLLVRFDRDVKAMGLECHNELSNPLWSNALWMRVSDLEFL